MDNLLEIFIQGYGQDAKPQELEKIKGDFQLTELKVLLNDIVNSSTVDRIIDIGCGNGVLINVIDELSIFYEHQNIEYFGYDSVENIKNIFSRMFEKEYSNRVTVRRIEDKFEKDMKCCNLIIMRNVFHELTIDQIVDYLFRFSENLSEKDVLIFQDTTTLLEAEKGRAGWTGNDFKNIMTFCGFTTIMTPDSTKKGIDVFTLKACNNRKLGKSKDEIKEYVVKCRKAQLDMLVSLYAESNSVESELFHARLSHDILAIKKQLGFEIGKEADEAIFQLLYYALIVCSKNENHIKSLKKDFEFYEIKAFQNRGTPLQIFYKFITSSQQSTLAVIGGRLIGKKSFIYHAMKRFEHDRLPIYFHGHQGINFPVIFEQIVESLQIVKYFDIDLISELKTFTLNDIITREKYILIMEKIAKEVVLVFYNFENFLDADGNIENKDIYDFINWWGELDEGKLIVESDKKIKWEKQNEVQDIFLTIFPESQDSLTNPYGKYKFVIQYFQETIPPSFEMNIEDSNSLIYQLLKNINNHPYLAYLASKKICSQKELSCLKNKEFIDVLVREITHDFLKNFTLTSKEIELVYILSLKPDIIDNEIVHKLDKYKEEISSLTESGILYKENNHQFRILAIFNNVEFAIEQEEKNKLNEFTVSMYDELYKETNKPSYLRQKYFITLLNDPTKIDKKSYYIPEIIQSAEKYYSNKKYKECVVLYDVVKHMQKLTSKQHLSYSSAKIRSGEIKEGIEEYKKIFKTYPDWIGANFSCVDSLLSVSEEPDFCLEILDKFSDEKRNSYYYRQLGDVYRIKQDMEKVFSNYDLALEKFEKYEDAERVVIRAISYSKEIGADEKMLKYFNYYFDHINNNSEIILIEYASYLEKHNEVPKSKDILEKLYNRCKDDPYYILAYVKVLCTSSDMNRADDLIKESYKNDLIRNKSIISSAKVHYYMANSRFDDAIECLRGELKNATLNIHLLGQWADAHYKKYNVSSDSDKEILKNGLMFYDKIIRTTNVPALMSCYSLAKLAGLTKEKSILKRRINEINKNYILEEI